MLKGFIKLIIALNGNVKKTQIAAGFAWGLLLGLVPIGNFFWIVLFLASFFFTHNHGSKIFFMALVKIFSFAIAPAMDNFGWWFLNLDALNPMFTTMYNMPFVPFTKFNNTLVAGGLVMGALLWIPTYIIAIILIPLYREKLGPKIKNSKFVKTITKFPLFGVIDKVISSVGD